MDILEVIGGHVQTAGSLGGKPAALTEVRLLTNTGTKVSCTIVKQEVQENVLTLGVRIPPTQAPASITTVELHTPLGLYASVSTSPPLQTSTTDIVLFEQTFIFAASVSESLLPYVPPLTAQIPQVHVDSLPAPEEADSVLLVSGVTLKQVTKPVLASKNGDSWTFNGMLFLGKTAVKSVNGPDVIVDISAYDEEDLLVTVVSGKSRGFTRCAVYNSGHLFVGGKLLELDATSVLAVYRHMENLLPPALPKKPNAHLLAGSSADYSESAHRLELKWLHFSVPAGEYAVRIPDYSVQRSQAYENAHLVYAPRLLAKNTYAVKRDWLLLATPLSSNVTVTMLVFEQVVGDGYQVVTSSRETDGLIDRLGDATTSNLCLFSTDGIRLTNTVSLDEAANQFLVEQPPSEFIAVQVHSVSSHAARYEVTHSLVPPDKFLAVPEPTFAFAANQTGVVPVDLKYRSGGFFVPAGDFLALLTIQQREAVVSPPKNYVWGDSTGIVSTAVTSRVFRENKSENNWINTQADVAWVFYNGLLAKPGDYLFLPGVGVNTLKAGNWTVVAFTVDNTPTASADCSLNIQSWPWDNKPVKVEEHQLLFVGGLLHESAGLAVTPDAPLDTPITLVSFNNIQKGVDSTALFSVSSTDSQLSYTTEGALTPLVFVDRLFAHNHSAHSWNGQTVVYTTESAGITILGLEKGQLSKYRIR